MVWLRRVATLLCHMLGIGGNANGGGVSPFASQIIDLIGRLLACRFPMVTPRRPGPLSLVSVPARHHAWPQYRVLELSSQYVAQHQRVVS